MGYKKRTPNTYDLLATKVLTYVNEEDKNGREVAWVVDEYEDTKIREWNSVIDLGKDDAEELVEPDLVQEARYELLTPSVDGNVDLHLADGTFTEEDGTASTATSRMYTKTTYVKVIDKEHYNFNDLMIFKNGTLQDKVKDIAFAGEDTIRFVLPLDAGDIIHVRKQIGL
jgi:hypothetical protein